MNCRMEGKMIADRVFKNAKLYSVDVNGKETRAQSVAIKDGKFVFVGTNEDADEFIGENTQVTDCNGGSILPGFCDAHMHIAGAIRRFGVADLNDLVTDFNTQTVEELVKEIQKRVKAFADSHPDDAVIHGSGWDRFWFEGSLGGKTYILSRHDIDAVVPDRPVALDSACGHACLFNTKALELAGVDKDYVEPKGSIVHRDADGMPTGYVQEPDAILEIGGRIPGYEYSEEQHRKALQTAQDYFASRGFTYLSDLKRMDRVNKIMKEMAENGELKLRIDGVFNCSHATRDKDMEKAISEKGLYNVGDVLKIDTVKYFIDEEFSMFEPYEESYCEANGIPKDSGMAEKLLWNLDNYRESMEKAKKAGYNIHVHSYGDRATHETIRCMLEARKANPDKNLRDIIAHIFFINDEDTKLMAENGIIGSIQPQWESANVRDCAMIVNQVGEERFKGIYPNGSLARAGVRLANGSDFMVTMPDALEGITVAMTRKFPKSHRNYNDFKNDPATDPDEANTLKDSIMGWTINGAYQFGREDITGSIEVGKSAEMVVLDGDIENTPVEDICLMKVMETLFKGQTTYKA